MSFPSTLTAGEIIQQAKKIEQEAQRKAREEAERKRIQKLEQLAQQENIAWAKVNSLLDQKRSTAYSEATELLVELYELAEFKNQELNYQQRFQAICTKYGKSVALMERFRRAGLL
jgi:hypothetical protein